MREPVKQKMREVYFVENPDIFRFLDAAIDLEKVEASRSIVFKADTKHFLESLILRDWEFIGNLALINDLQWINQFLIEVNHKLVHGGYFLGVAETLDQRLKRRYSGFPRVSRRLLHMLDFIWTRVFPKVGGLKKIYFGIREKTAGLFRTSKYWGGCVFADFRLSNGSPAKKEHFIS